MRIVYFSDLPTMNTSYGTQGAYIAKYLAGLGHEVHYVAEHLVAGGPIQYNGYTMHPATTRGTDDKDILNIFDIIDAVNPHIVISHEDIQRVRMLAAKQRDHIWIGNCPVDTEDFDIQMIEVLRMIDFKVFESQISKTFAESIKISNCLDIPCVVNTDVFKPLRTSKAELRDKYTGSFTEGFSIKPDDFVMLFVGRPNWRKNFPTIISTVDRLVHAKKKLNVKCIMHFDENDPAAVINYWQWIKALDLSKNMIITKGSAWDKGVEQSALAEIYNMADVYFQPHGGEGFGITMAEAMCCGLPLIATNYTSSKEMIGDNERGTKVPFARTMEMYGVQRPVPDTMACVDALLPYIESREVCVQKGKMACGFGQTNYNMDKTLEKWGMLVKACEYNRLDGGFNE